jgi:two-component system chemotaxis response regulator CheB
MSALVVEELTQATQLKPGYVYIAQGDANIEMFSQSGRLCARPNSDISDSIWRPSITKLVESALSVMLPKKICFVQLTGMGNDGAHAMARAYQLGATTIAESEQTATVYGMPKELVKLGGASMVLPNYDIANALLALK